MVLSSWKGNLYLIHLHYYIIFSFFRVLCIGNVNTNTCYLIRKYLSNSSHLHHGVLVKSKITEKITFIIRTRTNSLIKKKHKGKVAYCVHKMVNVSLSSCINFKANH